MRIIAPPQNKGQILVLFILVMVIALTVGLSIASRSLKTVSNVTSTQRSDRAFNAAEAGVEDALSKDLSTLADTGSTSITVGNAKTSYQVSSVGSSPSFTVNKSIAQDDAVEINLLNVTANSLDIYWADKDKNEAPTCGTYTPGNMPASLEMFFIREESTDVFSIPSKYAFNACDGVGNGFNDSTSTPPLNVVYNQDFVSGSTTLHYRAKVNVPLPSISGSQKHRIIRIKTWYNKATLTVVARTGTPNPTGFGTLPVQAYKITSFGEATDRPGGQGTGVKKSVEVVKSSPTLPGIFNNVIYNGGAQRLTK